MQTVYTTNFTAAYILTASNTLYKLPIPKDTISTSQIESQLETITSPPSNSTLLIDLNDNLFAVWGSKPCDSPLEISKYDLKSNQWSSYAQSSQKWCFNDQNYWVDKSEQMIYAFGGSCGSDYYENLFGFNITSHEFVEFRSEGSQASPGAISPRSMSLASSISLSPYQTLFLGGHSGNAWMSLQQIAIYNYGAWSFHPVLNTTAIDARDSPLLLPLFSQSGGSQSIDKILIIGGTVAGRAAVPSILELEFNNKEGWKIMPYRDLDSADAYFTVYDTVGVLSANSGVSTPNSNKFSLYQASSSSDPWSSVQHAKIPQSEDTTSSSSSKSTTLVAVLSTVLPLISIVVVCCGGYFYWRRRRERKLKLLPNKRSMLRIPSVASNASFDSLPEELYAMKPRQGLRITNPDPEPYSRYT